jgi:hypothetical protein
MRAGQYPSPERQRTWWIATFVLTLAVVSMPVHSRAEVRTLEVVGTASIDPTRLASVVPRDEAISQALREAVVRVAKDFLADQPLDEAETGPEFDQDGEPVEPESVEHENRDPLESPSLEEPEDPLTGEAMGPMFDEPEGPDFDAILGKKMVPYTLRFRVIEDRGRRPALFSDDPDVSEEYMVIVEVQVDVDRIHAKLVDAGLLLPGQNLLAANEVRLEVEGLTYYPAYLAMRRFLEGPLGATAVYPVEMGHGRTILDVETPASAVEFLEHMLTVAPPEIEIVPVSARGNQIHIVVYWVTPNAIASPDLEH